MNLHSITPVIPARRHYWDYVLDENFFDDAEDGFAINNTYGTLIDLWIENGTTYGIWQDHEGIRWKIYVHEYQNDYDQDIIRTGKFEDLCSDEWYVDHGHCA